MSRALNTILAASLAAALLGACSSGSSPERTIVGSWTGTDGGTERAFVFGTDGSFQLVSEGITWDGTYVTSGETLALHVTSGSAGGLPIIDDLRYSGTFTIASDGSGMTLTLQNDPPQEEEPWLVHLVRQ